MFMVAQRSEVEIVVAPMRGTLLHIDSWRGV